MATVEVMAGRVLRSRPDWLFWICVYGLDMYHYNCSEPGRLIEWNPHLFPGSGFSAARRDA